MSIRITHFNALAAGPSLMAEVKVAASKTSGQIVSIQNPEKVPVMVERAFVLVDTTGSSAACTVNMGIATTSTSSDNLIDGLSLNVVPIGLYDNIEDKGSNGKSRQYMGATDYWTVSVATGDANGFEGKFFCSYHKISGGP